MVGLNPEFAHETMSGLSFTHAVAQTLWHGKLFHIDLNAQRIGKYDQDFRFGSEGIRDAFYLVKLLEDAGWDGMRHFDAHPYRTEDADGVWDFARGCMRTYLILADKARRFHEDAEIQEALRTAQAAGLGRADAARGRARRDPGVRLRRGRTRDPGLRPRAPRPARHRTAARRALQCRSSSASTRPRRRARCRCATPTPARSSRRAGRRIPRRPRRGASSTRATGGPRSQAPARKHGVPDRYRPAAVAVAGAAARPRRARRRR